MSDLNAQWWYEKSGAQAGPVTFAVLQQLAATGELKPSTMVWTAGMAGWGRAETVAGLTWPASGAVAADADAARAPEPPGEPPPSSATAASAPHTDPVPAAGTWRAAAAPPPAGSAADAVQSVEEINILPTMVLSIITFSIYGIVKFFHTGKAYERLVGRETRFTTWFWVFVGTLAGGAILNAGGSKLGVLLSIAAVVFQFLTLSEALKNRNEGMRRWSLHVPVTSDNTHYVLLALGIVLSPIFIGIVLLIVQGVKWFQDWNAIRAAALLRTRQATALRA